MSATPKQCVSLTHASIDGVQFDRIEIHPSSGVMTLVHEGRTQLMLKPDGVVSYRRA